MAEELAKELEDVDVSDGASELLEEEKHEERLLETGEGEEREETEEDEEEGEKEGGDEIGDVEPEDHWREPAHTQCDECETEFQEYIRDHFGVEVLRSLKDKYGDDSEIVKGLINAYSLVGRKTEEADVIKALRGAVGDQKVEELLKVGKRALERLAGEEQTAKKEEPLEIDEGWYNGEKVRIDPDSGEFIPGPQGTAEDVKRFQRFLKERERVLNEFTRDPKAYLKQIVAEYGDELKKSIYSEIQQYALAAWEQTAKQIDTSATIEGYIESNKDLLFVDGDPAKGHTRAGKRLLEISDELCGLGVPAGRPRVELAHRLLMSEIRGSAKEQKPVKQAAKRSGASTQKRLSVDDLIEQGYSISEAFSRLGL